MASLLNDLDKLDAADNNSTEPDPTNIVAEDIDSNGSLVNVYLSADEVSRDIELANHSKIVADSGLSCTWSFKKLEKNDKLFVCGAFYSFWFSIFILSVFLFVEWIYFVQLVIKTFSFMIIHICFLNLIIREKVIFWN